VQIIKVKGISLYPEYHDGDFVIISKIPIYFGCIKPGDVVVFDHPIFGRMIKKISSKNDDGSLTVIGYHSESLDSRQLGKILKSRLIGKVLFSIKR